MKQNFMLRLIPLLLMTPALVGCSLNPLQTKVNSVEHSKEVKTHVVSKEEAALKEYYDNLLQSNFEKAANSISETQLEHTQETRQQLIDWQSDLRTKGEFRLKEYTIKRITTINVQTKSAIVDLRFKIGSETQTLTELVILRMEHGEWKLDFSGVLNEKSVPLKPFTIHNNALTISDVKIEQRLKGIGIKLTLTTHSENAVRFGLQHIPTAILKTDKGVFETKINRFMIIPNQSISYSFIFDKALGTPNQLTISEVYLTKIDGISSNQKKPFAISIPLGNN